MERIAEILRLLEDPEAITDEVVGELEAELLTIFDAVRAGDYEGVEATDLATLQSIASGIEALRALAAIRVSAAEDLNAQITELELTLRPAAEMIAEGDDGVDDGSAPAEAAPAPAEAAESEGEGEGEPEGDTDAPADVAPAEELEPVLASARPPLAAIRVPGAFTRPRPQAPARETVVISGPNGRLANLSEAATVMADAWNGSTETMGKRKLVKVEGRYPKSRQLDRTDQDTNMERVLAVTAGATDPDRWDEATVASGGFCAPTEVDYNEVIVAEAVRPVRDSLPGFQATRGGVRMPDSPNLSSITTAVGVWDNATDTSPEGATKGIQTIDCSAFDEYLTQAITARLRWGNFGARAFPENLEAWNTLVMAAHARLAEEELLDQIKALCTAVTQGQLLGAARDIVEAVIRAVATQRSFERTPNARYRALIPSWVPDLMAADLVRSHREDGIVQVVSEEMRRTLADAGINVTFYVDSPTTGPSQNLAGQVDATALAPWPCDVQWAIYPEGRFVFLDGGALDLGIIRDSTLNETNDLENFSETFEGIATAGGPQAVWVTSTVLANGAARADEDVDPDCDNPGS